MTITGLIASALTLLIGLTPGRTPSAAPVRFFKPCRQCIPGGILGSC